MEKMAVGGFIKRLQNVWSVWHPPPPSISNLQPRAFAKLPRD